MLIARRLGIELATTIGRLRPFRALAAASCPRARLAAVAALAALAAPAAAQFDLLNWTYSATSSGSGTVTPEEMVLVGPDYGCQPNKFVAWTAVAPFDGTVVVGANYYCFDEEFGYDSFNYLVGSATLLVSDSHSWNGQLVFDVPAGETFGFSVGTTDCILGEGVATLSDFSFIPKLGPMPAVDGVHAGEHFGSRLALAGDLDGDGSPDLIVGVPDGSVGGLAAGRVAVVRGDLGSTLLSLAGAEAGDDFGFGVAGGEDLNADGVPDLLVGSPKADVPVPVQTDAGRIELRSGADGSVIRALDGTKAFDKLGFAVAFVGDIDGDGVADVAAGAPFHDAVASNAGQALVLSGATGGVLLVLEGEAAGDRFGSALAGASDIDRDGVPDVIVGAPGPGSAAGRVTAWSGADGTLLVAFDHVGEAANLGTAVAGGGDFDGDGVPDVVATAPSENGSVYAHSGADGSMLHAFSAEVLYDEFGSSVAVGDDLDGDGADELILGTTQGGYAGKGYVQIRSGRTGDVLYVQPGDEVFGDFGSAVAPLGDVDGDGRPDIAVGVPFSDKGGVAAGGVRSFEPITQWTGDGPGLAGAFGVPLLTAKGLIGSGAPDSLLLQDALPHTTAALVAGISKLMVPLKGGVLVPAPDIVVPGLPVDNQGTMTLPFTWPAGVPSGFEMWLQMWVAEPTSLQGFSATNGLHAVAP